MPINDLEKAHNLLSKVVELAEMIDDYNVSIKKRNKAQMKARKLLRELRETDIPATEVVKSFIAASGPAARSVLAYFLLRDQPKYALAVLAEIETGDYGTHSITAGIARDLYESGKLDLI